MQQVNTTESKPIVPLSKQLTPANPVGDATAVKPEVPQTEGKRQCFINDLSPEEREQAVQEYAERIREQLSGETISINCMSRLLNMAHPKVTSLLAVTASAKEALLDTSTNKVVRAKSLLSKLSDEQRKLLIEQMQKESNS